MNTRIVCRMPVSNAGVLQSTRRTMRCADAGDDVRFERDV